MHLQHHHVTKVKKQLKVPRSIAAILLRLKAQGERWWTKFAFGPHSHTRHLYNVFEVSSLQ